MFPVRTGIGSIPAKRFLRLPRWRRYFFYQSQRKVASFRAPSRTKCHFILTRALGLRPSPETSSFVSAGALARILQPQTLALPFTRAWYGLLPGKPLLHPEMNAIFSLKVRARRPELPLPAKTKACVSPTRDGINWFYANLQVLLVCFSTGYFRLPNLT